MPDRLRTEALKCPARDAGARPKETRKDKYAEGHTEIYFILYKVPSGDGCRHCRDGYCWCRISMLPASGSFQGYRIFKSHGRPERRTSERQDCSRWTMEIPSFGLCPRKVRHGYHSLRGQMVPVASRCKSVLACQGGRPEPVIRKDRQRREHDNNAGHPAVQGP